MWWRRLHRKARKPAHRSGETRPDYGAASGRHRLSDGDTVPVRGYRTFREILNDQTRELPPADTYPRPLLTPGQEQRGGFRNWLASWPGSSIRPGAYSTTARRRGTPGRTDRLRSV